MLVDMFYKNAAAETWTSLLTHIKYIMMFSIAPPLVFKKGKQIESIQDVCGKKRLNPNSVVNLDDSRYALANVYGLLYFGWVGVGGQSKNHLF